MRQISILFAYLILFLSNVRAQDSSNLKIPGLKILTRSLPLTPSKNEEVVRIRCMSSQLNYRPLFVIDGIVADEYELRNINPDDIESISILKGHMATAIYGCEAS